jgi:acyl carrier protein
MDDLDERLTQCFRGVFPDWSGEQIHSAKRSEQSEWDSLATLSLLAVLEEEFVCQLDDADIEHLDSFEGARAAVQRVAT